MREDDPGMFDVGRLYGWLFESHATSPFKDHDSAQLPDVCQRYAEKRLPDDHIVVGMMNIA